MRTYLAPIGFNSTAITRPVLSNGIDSGDEVILIRPDVETMDDRADNAVSEVTDFLQEVEPAVSVDMQSIDHAEFDSAVLDCADTILAASDEVFVILGGGARDILLPFTVATLAHVESIDGSLFYSDLSQEVIRWTLPDLTASTTQQNIETLQLIVSSGEISVPDLTSQSEKSKSTITRHMSQLETEGLIITWKEGKTKFARPSITGELYAV